MRALLLNEGTCLAPVYEDLGHGKKDKNKTRQR